MDKRLSLLWVRRRDRSTESLCTKAAAALTGREHTERLLKKRSSYLHVSFLLLSKTDISLFLQRCKRRLRESREKFLRRFRNITSEVVKGEDPAIRGSSSDASSDSAPRVPSPSSIASSVHEVMREEWEHVRMEYGNLPCVPAAKRSKVAPEDPLGSDDFSVRVRVCVVVCVCVCDCVVCRVRSWKLTWSWY